MVVAFLAQPPANCTDRRRSAGQNGAAGFVARVAHGCGMEEALREPCTVAGFGAAQVVVVAGGFAGLSAVRELDDVGADVRPPRPRHLGDGRNLLATCSTWPCAT